MPCAHSKLDPDNLDELLELAELSIRSHRDKIAMPALLRAAQLARRAGDEGRWEEIAEKAYALDPNDEVPSLSQAEVYLMRENATEAARLIAPVLARKPDDPEVLDLACRAYIGIGNHTQAQPLCWKLYHARPERADIFLKLMEGLLQLGAVRQVLETAHQLKTALFQQNRRDEFLRIIEHLYQADPSNLEVLEFLSSLYDEMNKEEGLRGSLSRLFDLSLANADYRKAGDTLERILDVEPYGAGSDERLAKLQGRIDPVWYKNILARIQLPASPRESPDTIAEAVKAEETETLEDLVVEGEMYRQYQLSAKLSQKVQQLNELFPDAAEKNSKVRDLFKAAGYTPKSQITAAVTTARADAVSAGGSPFQSLDDLRRISEIIANICRESTPQGVLHVAVNEIGRAMNASRCWAAFGVPGQPPVLVAEYSSPLASPSDLAAALKLFAFLVGQSDSGPDGWSFENATQEPLLSPVMTEIHKLGIRSLHAIPLVDKDVAAGLLLLEQCEELRTWSPSESLLLRTIATQIVVATTNTRFRRLVRSRAGADTETGLLPRSAYLECLLSEARRAREQALPLSVCLLEPENPQALMKSLGEAGVRLFQQQIARALTPILRRNDMSIRYSPLSVAVVFPDTALPQASLAVEKARRVMAQVKTRGAATTTFCAAVCDVPLGPTFDAVDGVTEVINRLELSLDRAQKEGGKRLLISRFSG